MNIAISGATGFIGQYVSKYFAKEHHLILLTRKQQIDISGFGENCKIVDVSCNDEALKEALNETDVFIHLAAKRPAKEASDQNFSDYIDILQFTNRLLNALQGSACRHIINISTKGVYGPKNTSPFTENQVPHPSSLYGLSKLFTEQLLDWFGDVNNIGVCHLRLGQVIGWGEKKKNIITVFLDNALKDKKLQIWGNGVGTRSYIYVKDVVNAIETAIKNQSEGIYNISWRKDISHAEMAETINKVFNNPQLEYLSDKPEDTSTEFISTQKATEVLNWVPVFSTLEDALIDMKKDYEKENI